MSFGACFRTSFLFHCHHHHWWGFLKQRERKCALIIIGSCWFLHHLQFKWTLCAILQAHLMRNIFGKLLNSDCGIFCAECVDSCNPRTKPKCDSSKALKICQSKFWFFGLHQTPHTAHLLTDKSQCRDFSEKRSCVLFSAPFVASFPNWNF